MLTLTAPVIIKSGWTDRASVKNHLCRFRQCFGMWSKAPKTASARLGCDTVMHQIPKAAFFSIGARNRLIRHQKPHCFKKYRHALLPAFNGTKSILYSIYLIKRYHYPNAWLIRWHREHIGRDYNLYGIDNYLSKRSKANTSWINYSQPSKSKLEMVMTIDINLSEAR